MEKDRGEKVTPVTTHSRHALFCVLHSFPGVIQEEFMLCSYVQVPQQELDLLFKHLDTNKDGEISFQEFHQARSHSIPPRC